MSFAKTGEPNSRTTQVFVNFADHGGGQLIAMPNGEFLKAQELNAALQTMHSKQMYKSLVFYVEACLI